MYNIDQNAQRGRCSSLARTICNSFLEKYSAPSLDILGPNQHWGQFGSTSRSYFRILSQLLSTKNTAFLPAAVITGKEFLSFDLEYLLWLRPLHTAEKHHPTMFHTATVRPTRSGPNILYNTSLKCYK